MLSGSGGGGSAKDNMGWSSEDGAVAESAAARMTHCEVRRACAHSGAVRDGRFYPRQNAVNLGSLLRWSPS